MCGQPRIAFGRADRERGVAHTQAGMAPLVGVMGRPAAPVLREEPREMRLRRGSGPSGYSGRRTGSLLDAGVEAVDELDEEGETTDRLVDRDARRSGRRVFARWSSPTRPSSARRTRRRAGRGRGNDPGCCASCGRPSGRRARVGDVGQALHHVGAIGRAGGSMPWLTPDDHRAWRRSRIRRSNRRRPRGTTA